MTEMTEMTEAKDVLILPNGYGSLSYIDALSEYLACEFGKNVYIPEYQGTKDIKGALNVNVATLSIANKISEITKINEKQEIVIIAHCSSVLTLINLGSNSDYWKNVKHVIIYSYLANPKKHLGRFLKKSKEYGVNLNISDDYNKINSFSANSLLSIPVPIHVIHPDIKLNKLRANAVELEELSKIPNVINVDKPENGYEISNDQQNDTIKYIADNFYRILM